MEANPAKLTADAASGTTGGAGHGVWLRWLQLMLRNRKALFGVVILALFGVIALLAPVIRPGNPTAFVAASSLSPSWAHPLGTTGNGQDDLQQLLWGARVSLSVAFLVGTITTLIATLVGIAAAYLGGTGDAVLSLLMNVFLLIPGLPLIITLALFLPPGAVTIVLVLAFTGWAWPARILRAQALSLRQRDFVAAAVVSGEPGWRVMVGEMLPNIWSIVVANFMGSTVYAIGAEAALEFIGLGDVHQVTWGTMLYWAENFGDLEQGAWWTFVPPGLAIALVAFGLIMCNYAMDEITNPRLRSIRREMRSSRLPWALFRRGRAGMAG
ncbi:MAG TPA: ABC transporter permease [Candidatus Dormibacteraeota bacterium]|jgi:peptide/nickel transport system permease protein|nr:ABC transporter permease [Candidatus Dormibacteraeota bacterium]